MLCNAFLILVCLLSSVTTQVNNDGSIGEEKITYEGAPYKDDYQIEYDFSQNLETAESSDSSSSSQAPYLTDNYAAYYFSNMVDNYGYNKHNSCGFVATGLLLSFWDTYWDDGIIAENYDATSTLDEDYINLDDDISPGILREPTSLINVSNLSTYHENISKYADTYFHFKLIDLFMKNIEEREAGEYGLAYQDYVKFYNFYVYDYLGYSTDQVEIISYNKNVRDETIALVEQGIPVKLGIGDHAVVAYDYDEDNDEIYCHFGWGVEDRHVTIESKGYSSYTNLVAFKFKDDHHSHHSNNYTYTNEYGDSDTLCACSLVCPQEVKISSGNYLDSLPTYTWQSLIHEKWHESAELYFNLSVLSPSKVALYTFTNISDPSYTLDASTWISVLDNSYTSYYIYVRLESPNELYWDEYYASTKFSKPKDYANKIQMKPSDWGFEGRYYFAGEGDSSDIEYRETTYSLDDLTITAQRLRCGYIEEQYVNLSPRREDAGVAYLRLTFDKPVYSYMFGASFWSKNEYLDSSTGTAIVRTMSSSGTWSSTPDFDLLSEDLSTTRSEIKRFYKYHLLGIYGLEFYSTAVATGSRNKGRICLDDIVLSTSVVTMFFLSTSYPSIG